MTSAPYPIRALRRRARNAKSPKERHDTAYYAWEASVRLGVAARPPADASALAMPSVGQWAAALSTGDGSLTDAGLLAVASLFAETAQGKPSSPRSVTGRKLVVGLAAYRNQVLGHGATRTAEFYDDAADRLLAALDAAWENGLFLPAGTSLVYVDGVLVDAAGRRRARVIDLDGDAPQVLDAKGTLVGDDVLPGRLYSRTGDRHFALHPWLIYDAAELRERVLFFNGRARSSQYLDYVGGESLKGKALSTAFPTIEEDVASLLSGSPRSAPDGEPSADRPVSAPAAEPKDPGVFGEYRILGKLGQGGMGVVYLARQQSLGRLVALKVQSEGTDDEVARGRFLREVRALSRCDHPNVVKILASGEEDSKPYYVMELIEGADLQDLAVSLGSSRTLEAAISTASDGVRKAKKEAFADVPLLEHAAPEPRGAESPERRVQALAALFRDAARAIGALHQAGVLHRDIKPSNLMVTAVDRRIVVMDLGLATLSDASRALTRDATALLGTLRYMPPEQLQRSLLDLDARADVYALGATFYELFTGRPFLDGTTEAQLVEQVLHRSPPPPRTVNAAIPADLSMILEQATRKDRSQRYPDAASLERDLDAFLEGRAISARPLSALYRARLAARRHRGALAGAAVAAVVLAAVGVPAIRARMAPHTCVLGDLEDCTAQCDRMNAASCATLGAMFDQGTVAPKDQTRAAGLFARACDGGSSAGCYGLGLLLGRGEGGSRDEVRARAVLERACDLGEAQGCNALAILLAEGRGGAADPVRAAGLYERACQMHYPGACGNLGVLHERGEGVPKDPARARALYLQACNEGAVSSCGVLATTLAGGRGGEKDEAQAALLFERACNAGHAFACTGLGELKERGAGTPKDVAGAAALYKRACEHHPIACHNLARLHERGGGGVEENMIRALGLFEHACEAGVPESCAELGTLFVEGRGVAKDEERGRAFLKRGCEGGVQAACDALATPAEAGAGTSVPLSPTAAPQTSAPDARSAAATPTSAPSAAPAKATSAPATAAPASPAPVRPSPQPTRTKPMFNKNF